MTSVPTTVPTSTDGQPLGTRGLRTRQRILEAVARGIQENGLRGLRLADVAAEVGFSQPAFYQYFNDLDEAILALCEEIGHLLPAFPFSESGWSDGDFSSESTRAFVSQFFEYWDQHRAVLWSRNVAVIAGDDRFQSVRDETFRPMGDAIRARIETGQREGRIDPSVSPRGLNAALVVMLDRIGMIGPQLIETWGTDTAEDLMDALAYIFDRVLGVPAEDTIESPRSPSVARARGQRG